MRKGRGKEVGKENQKEGRQQKKQKKKEEEDLMGRQKSTDLSEQVWGITGTSSWI